MSDSATGFGVFRQLPFMGVIRVNVEAMRRGYVMGDPDWSNLGQGQPEVGDIPGCPPRIADLDIDPADHAYGPVEGVREVREAIAAHYNRLYRAGKSSRYTWENVALAPGGRAALTRLLACMKPARVAYFSPDYTAYEDLLTTFPRIEPVWVRLDAADGFRLSPDALRATLERERISRAGGVLISNPCNPTGVVIAGAQLAAWAAAARELAVTLIMDEFYSHYIYNGPAHSVPGGVSAAQFVDDVDRDPIVITDGMTKCFRYPGWRVGWVLAPKPVINALAAAGSFLDGGSCRPMQRLVVRALEPARADQELAAVRKEFAIKHDLTLRALTSVGVRFPAEASGLCGTFYLFGDVSALPPGMNTGESFMHAAMSKKVLTVPGEYFDVNPGRNRPGESYLKPFVRFSFGPTRSNLEQGLERLVAMVRAAGGR